MTNLAMLIELGARAMWELTPVDLYVIECPDKEVKSTALTLPEVATALAALTKSPYPCREDHIIREARYAETLDSTRATV